MGGERQSLIDVELARTEFRLDVIKLRKQLTEIGVRKSSEAPAPTVVTTRQGTVVEPASGSGAVTVSTPRKAEAGSAEAGSA